MPNYHYVQQVGGAEEWKPIPAGVVKEYIREHSPNFVTVHAVSKITQALEKEELDKLTYSGPLNFDFDGKDLEVVIGKCNILLSKLSELGLNLASVRIYATGGRGFHIEVPAKCFMEKIPKHGTQNLPTIYREIALELFVDTLDLRVYSQRSGRMWRVPGNLRDNGLYKVPVTLDEVREMTTESYAQLCSAPRPEMAAEASEFCVDLAVLYAKSAQKVEDKMKARGKHKRDPQAKAKAQMPSVIAMMAGQGIRPDAGFHAIAMQVAICASAASRSEAQMLKACVGLIESHSGDGNRYNTPAKRREELSRMFAYCDENPCYEFSVGAVKSLLTHEAPDLDGIAVTKEEIAEVIAEAAEVKLGPDGTVEVTPDEFGDTTAGVTLSKFGVYADSEFGKKRICAVSFSDIHLLMSMETGQLNAYEAQVLVNGRPTGRQTMEMDTFSSVQIFNRFCARLGHAMQGSEPHVRGLMMRFVELAKKKGRMRYIAKREGLDVVNIPNHDDAALRAPFSVWADRKGVIVDPRLQPGQVDIVYQGYPSPEGRMRSDLADAPQLVEWLQEPGNKEALRETLENLFNCQRPEALGKLIGWYCAATYRMLFHRAYKQFPALHVNGSAGAGKTSMQTGLMSLYYYNQEPKRITPGSSIFACQEHMASSASIPLILDEYKPNIMSSELHNRYKLMIRDAYNCTSVAKGGGNRDSDDYRSLHETELSAPLCFIAEAAEDESAVSERVVLVTLVKPASSVSNAWAVRYQAWSRNSKHLTILGKWLVAQAVNTATIEGLRDEFDPIYNGARETYLLNASDLKKNLTAEAMSNKQNAKERSVYNFTVARFGLLKFRALVESIYGVEEFKSKFDEMDAGIYTRMADLQSATQAEWSKVLSMMSTMSHHVDPEAPYSLRRDFDYAFVDVGGRDCIEIALRNAYIRYRSYIRNSGQSPLFTGDLSFLHAIKDCSALVDQGVNRNLHVPGIYTFDVNELSRLGVPTFKG